MEPKNNILSKTTGATERRHVDMIATEYASRKQQLIDTHIKGIANHLLPPKSSLFGDGLFNPHQVLQAIGLRGTINDLDGTMFTTTQSELDKDTSFRKWHVIPIIMLNCRLSFVAFTVSNRHGYENTPVFTMNDAASYDESGDNLRDSLEIFEGRIIDEAFNAISQDGELGVSLRVTSAAEGMTHIELEMDGDAEPSTYDFSTPDVINGHAGVSFGSSAHNTLTSTALTAQHYSWLSETEYQNRKWEAFRTPKLSSLTDLYPPVPREQVLGTKPKEPFFRQLTSRAQMTFKIMVNFNRAVTYRTALQPALVDVRETVSLLPRYGDGSFQSWNILIEQESDRLEAYSLMSLKGTYAGKAFLFKDWHSDLAQDTYFLYHVTTDTFYRYEGGSQDPTVVLPGPMRELAVAMLERCGGVFKARLHAYITSVQAQLPVKRQVGPQAVVEEAAKLYLAGFEKQQQQEWRITTSPAIPKLGKYRGPLSKATGRKKPPHDRSPHKNRRYNPDGTVRLEWDVAATKVNGGIEARHGAQISDIISYKEEQ